MRLIVIAAVVLSSCTALHAPLSPPSMGGADWIEVSTPHFVVHTDLSAADAKKRALDFEEVNAALLDLAFKSSDPPTDKVEVVVFSSRDDFQAASYFKWSGGFTGVSDVDDRMRIVVPSSFSDRERDVFQHELTHRFVHYFMPTAPTWLNEGMACFYETMRIEGRNAEIGKSKFRFVHGGNDSRGIAMENLPPASDFVDERRHAFYKKDAKAVDRNYAAAWLLVSMLITGDEHERFWAYVHDLTQGATHDDAWRAHFADVNIDQAFSDYRHRGRIGIARVPYQARPIPDDAVVVRAMTDDEISLLFATLEHKDAKHRKMLIARALSEAPKSAEAHYRAGLLSATKESGFGESELAKAVALAPNESRYVLALADAHYRQERAKPAAEQDLLKLAPEIERVAQLADNANAQNFVGWYYAETGDPARGLPFATRSIALLPSCWECIDTVARLEFLSGDVRKAVELEARALTTFPGEQPPKELVAALEKYEAVLASAAGSEPPPPPPSTPPPPPPPSTPPPPPSTPSAP